MAKAPPVAAFRSAPIHKRVHCEGRSMPSTPPGPAHHEAPNRTVSYVMRKLPHVTVLFWLLKTVAVTLGETAGDLLGITLKLGYVLTALTFFVFFIAVLVFQIRAKRFHSAL